MTDTRSSTVPLSRALPSGTAGHLRRKAGHSAGQQRDTQSRSPKTTGSSEHRKRDNRRDRGGTQLSQAAERRRAEWGSAHARILPERCIECGHNPRAGSGQLSRCLSCIKAAAQGYRDDRDRRRRAAARPPVPMASPEATGR